MSLQQARTMFTRVARAGKPLLGDVMGPQGLNQVNRYRPPMLGSMSLATQSGGGGQAPQHLTPSFLKTPLVGPMQSGIKGQGLIGNGQQQKAEGSQESHESQSEDFDPESEEPDEETKRFDRKVAATAVAVAVGVISNYLGSNDGAEELEKQHGLTKSQVKHVQSFAKSVEVLIAILPASKVAALATTLHSAATAFKDGKSLLGVMTIGNAASTVMELSHEIKPVGPIWSAAVAAAARVTGLLKDIADAQSNEVQTPDHMTHQPDVAGVMGNYAGSVVQALSSSKLAVGFGSGLKIGGNYFSSQRHEELVSQGAKPAPS